MALIQTKGKGLTIEVPHTYGVGSCTAEVNWLDKLDDIYFRAGITFISPSSDPRVGGSTIMLIRKDAKQGLKALVNLVTMSPADMILLARCNDLEVDDV